MKNTWEGYYHGEWFVKWGEPDLIFNVCHAPKGLTAFMANRYWYNGQEAWNYGTCSMGPADYLKVAPAPQSVHDTYTSVKPLGKRISLSEGLLPAGKEGSVTKSNILFMNFSEKTNKKQKT